MKSKGFGIFFFPILLSVSSYSAEPSSSRLVQIRGAVEFQNPQTGAWLSAKKGQALQPGSQLKTGPHSWAQINTKSNDKLQLSPKTVIELKEVSSKQTSVKVLLGRLRSIVKRIKARRAFRVLTPLAVASVRGTEFDTNVEEDGRSTFEVFEGEVGVKDLSDIGAEVSVFKNQRTTVEAGAAPRPPEMMQEDKRGELREGRDRQETRQLARMEAQRELALQEFREQLQADVALEQRQAEYEDGKTVIDAFGMRVRVEEYIVRPDPKQFSFVTINTRLDSVSFSRYDAFAVNDLPRKIDDIGLLFKQSGDGSGTDTPSNWIERQKWFLSNGGDLYREWSEEGNPVWFASQGIWQVVFGHWFAEIKGKNESNFRLLSHWIPNPLHLGGQYSTTSENIGDDGALNIPDGYLNYENPGGGSGITGDERPIDSIAYENRLRNSDIFGSADYQTSEGYERNSYVELDGTVFSTLPTPEAKLSALLNAKKTSVIHEYTVDGAAVTSLRVDEYKVDDQGNVLSLIDRVNLGVGLDSINFQQVVSSPDYASKIDLVLSPRIFIKAGLVSGE